MAATLDLQSVLRHLLDEDTGTASQLVHKWLGKQCSSLYKESMEEHNKPTNENLSPISGINNADDNVDTVIDVDRGEEDPEGDPEQFDAGEDDLDLEDRVDSLEAEYAALKSQISQLVERMKLLISALKTSKNHLS
jgi:hypothetical protein